MLSDVDMSRQQTDALHISTKIGVSLSSLSKTTLAHTVAGTLTGTH